MVDQDAQDHQQDGHAVVVGRRERGGQPKAESARDLRQARRTDREVLESLDRIALRGAPDGEFRQHHRQADQRDAEEIDQDERAAAVLPRDEGEPPHVAESDGGTDRRHDESE